MTTRYLNVCAALAIVLLSGCVWRPGHAPREFTSEEWKKAEDKQRDESRELWLQSLQKDCDKKGR
jgi:hypothetical protein